MTAKRTALGKGLAALIPDLGEDERKGLLYCGIEEIIPNRSQPRKRFDEWKLDELAESIREKGILEPLVVRRVDSGYEIVMEAQDREALEISLIENLQRENLNPVEEAEGFRRLAEEFGLRQEELAKRIGKNRTTIANALRLLKLPQEVIEHLLQSRITAGHARAILSIEVKERQKELCQLIVQKGLSVRQAEGLAKRWSKKPKKVATPEKGKRELASQLNTLQDTLRRHLATKVRIAAKGKKGKIEIEYYSSEDLERIIETILGDKRGKA
jgi:ParB family chromosome partitioning protein